MENKLIALALIILLAFIAWSKISFVNHNLSLIGRQVVIQGDTLTILNYKYHEGLDLSNGSSIHEDVVESFIIEK